MGCGRRGEDQANWKSLRRAEENLRHEFADSNLQRVGHIE
jgi:hypothetical protein